LGIWFVLPVKLIVDFALMGHAPPFMASVRTGRLRSSSKVLAWLASKVATGLGPVSGDG
jgi:hypothetical protein